MRMLLLVLLVALTNIGFAQDEYVNHVVGAEKYHQFEVGDERYLLADHVNVRAEASSKADIVTKLSIGTAVKVIEISTEKLRLNRFKTNWYKVSFASKDAVTTGYVWGGLIAEGAIVCASNSKVLFLYGIASVTKEPKEAYTRNKAVMQVRACMNKKELSRLELKAAGNYLNIYHWLGNYGNKGLTNVDDIIELGESEQVCGGVTAYHFIFWDGKKLRHATTLRPAGDAPYYASDDLIFPSDKGGKKGKVIGDQQLGWHGEENEGDIVKSHKQVEYIWTGETLKQTKVLIDKEYDVEY